MILVVAKRVKGNFSYLIMPLGKHSAILFICTPRSRTNGNRKSKF